MASFYSDLATNQRDGFNFPGGGLTTQPGSYNDPNKEFGAMDVIIAQYTAAGTEATGDTIFVAKVPAGTAVLASLATLTAEAAGTGATLTLGDNDPAGASTTRYSTAVAVSSAVNGGTFAATPGAAFLTPFFTSDECFLTATVAASTVITAGKKFTWIIPVAQSR